MRIARGASIGAVALGATGFLSGFLGPIALSPESNQGPLLGIFITGPGGALLGGLLGASLGLCDVSVAAFRNILFVACTLVASTTLLFSTPPPEHRADLVDGVISGCAPASSRRDAALSYWNDVLARDGRNRGRPGWKDDLDRMLAEESSVVLQIHVLRKSSVFENRKPWNSGTLEVKPWTGVDREQSYFATYAGGSCASYPLGTKARFATSGQTSRQWPPEILANLLDLETIGPAPEEYATLLGS